MRLLGWIGFVRENGHGQEKTQQIVQKKIRRGAILCCVFTMIIGLIVYPKIGKVEFIRGQKNTSLSNSF